MRVRKVITRKTPRVVYKFPSLKMQRVVYCESRLELDYAYLLEFDYEVKSYQEQPLTLNYVLGGERHSYTVDFCVERASGSQLIETKMSEDVCKPDSQRFFAAVQVAADQRGYDFRIAESNQIRKEPRLTNVKLLWRYARTPLSPLHQLLCSEAFQNQSELSLEQIIECFRLKNCSTNAVYALIYHGHLEVDLLSPLKPNAAVRLPGKARNH